MSRENAEAFRRAIEAFNARDVTGMMAVFDPEVEFAPLVAGVPGSSYRGEQGVRDWLAAVDQEFELFRNECGQVEGHGVYVLAVSEGHGRGRASGVEIRQAWAQLAHFRGGRSVWWRTYRNREEALRDVGLPVE